MTEPREGDDGSAGDVDYGSAGVRYAEFRQPEPAIAEQILRAFADVKRVLNVGAGTGSYEPTDRAVVAVEPSATMRDQRPAHFTPAIDAVAENLPFTDHAFDAAMATFTVHQWSDLEKGIAEMKRVANGPIVIMTADPLRLHDFWVARYIPEAINREMSRFPRIDHLMDLLGAGTKVETVSIPLNCKDGFTEAYYRRPAFFLKPGVTGAMSSWTLIDQSVVEAFRKTLSHDLANGTWDREFGHLRTQPTFEGSLRLIIRP
jgi:SAM-dependent methyltransferase